MMKSSDSDSLDEVSMSPSASRSSFYTSEEESVDYFFPTFSKMAAVRDGEKQPSVHNLALIREALEKDDFSFWSHTPRGTRSVSYSTEGSLNTSPSMRRKSYAAVRSSSDPSTIEDRLAGMRRLLESIYNLSSAPCSEKDVTDTLTDTSMQSDCGYSSSARTPSLSLENKGIAALSEDVVFLQAEIDLMNSRLVRAVRQLGHQRCKRVARNAIITAVLQATSAKRSEDSQLKFSLEPGENGLEEWKTAMRSVAKLPGGVPPYFRTKLWTRLADEYLENTEWDQVRSTCLSPSLQEGDAEIHSCIIKDLHRTGLPGFNDEKKLKQVLLAYARYNKDVGYCQGFNVIVAMILQVVDFNTDAALKILIFLMEQVLPCGYFDQSLKALSVDMAVMKDLMLQRLPNTMKHLENLQSTSGNEYEPPLTNVFSMHWFLTLFATCLPRECVFRIWDGIMLEGSEVLLRTAIAIWARMSRRIQKTTSADEFYCLMEKLCKEMNQMKGPEQDSLITVIYSMSPFPYPGLTELREKYTWNIQPLSAAFKLFQKSVNNILHDDESDADTACGSSCRGSPRKTKEKDPDEGLQAKKSDLQLLQKQFRLLKLRQKQAAVILKSAYLHSHAAISERGSNTQTPVTESPCTPQPVFNHLQMGLNLANDSSVDAPTRLTGGAVSLSATIIQPGPMSVPGRNVQSPLGTLHSDRLNRQDLSPAKSPTNGVISPTTQKNSNALMRKSRAMLDSFRPASPSTSPLPQPPRQLNNMCLDKPNMQ